MCYLSRKFIATNFSFNKYACTKSVLIYRLILRNMDFNPEVRRNQLENLEQFIAESKEKVQNVLNALNWKPDKVIEENQLITCSLDTSHKIHRKNVEEHIKKCALRKENYNLDDQFLSEPTNNSKSSIIIDDHRKIEILSEAHKTKCGFRSGWNGQDPDPKTAERLTCTFSPDERLALYDYAVASTNGPGVVPDFDILNPRTNTDQALTYEEKLSRERDAKRRRIKYKSIHTSRKNYIEVIREVIGSQMDLYKDWVNECTTEQNNVSNEEKGQFNDKVSVEREPSISRASSHSSSSHKRYDDHYKEKYNQYKEKYVQYREKFDEYKYKYDHVSKSNKRSRDDNETIVRERRRESYRSHRERDYDRYDESSRRYSSSYKKYSKEERRREVNGHKGYRR